jgi:hypothetical protein
MKNLSKSLSVEQEKEIFENGYGKKISIRTWYRYRKLLVDNAVPVTSDNLLKLARFKKSLQHSNDTECFLKYLELIRKMRNIAEIYSGSAFLNLLSDTLEVDFHPSTVSRWFKDLGGFQKQSKYKLDSLIPVALKAFIVAKRVYK